MIFDALITRQPYTPVRCERCGRSIRPGNDVDGFGSTCAHLLGLDRPTFRRRGWEPQSGTDLFEINEGDEMSDTITIRLIEYGQTTVTLPRAQYDAAKEADRLDHLLDHDASDMDTDTTVVEPDGTRFNLHGYDAVFGSGSRLEDEVGQLLDMLDRLRVANEADGLLQAALAYSGAAELVRAALMRSTPAGEAAGGER